MEDGLDSASRMGDQDVVPGSWSQPGPASSVLAVSEVDQRWSLPGSPYIPQPSLQTNIS